MQRTRSQLARDAAIAPSFRRTISASHPKVGDNTEAAAEQSTFFPISASTFVSVLDPDASQHSQSSDGEVEWLVRSGSPISANQFIQQQPSLKSTEKLPELRSALRIEELVFDQRDAQDKPVKYLPRLRAGSAAPADQDAPCVDLPEDQLAGQQIGFDCCKQQKQRQLADPPAHSAPAAKTGQTATATRQNCRKTAILSKTASTQAKSTQATQKQAERAQKYAQAANSEFGPTEQELHTKMMENCTRFNQLCNQALQSVDIQPVLLQIERNWRFDGCEFTPTDQRTIRTGCGDFSGQIEFQEQFYSPVG